MSLKAFLSESKRPIVEAPDLDVLPWRTLATRSASVSAATLTKADSEAFDMFADHFGTCSSSRSDALVGG